MRRLTIARRELASLRSEKTIVLALLIQLFVAAFSSFLVVGLVSLYDPGATQGAYEVEVGVAGNGTDEVAPVVGAGETRNAVRYDSFEAAMTGFRRGEVDAVLDSTAYPDGRLVVHAIAPEGDFRTTLIVVQVKDALVDLERERRGDLSERLDRQPLPVPPERPASSYFGFTYTVLVPLLAFLPAFISGSVAADSLAEEVERGTLELLRVAPVSVPQILDGKALAMTALAPAQAALWLAFLALNGIHIANPVAVLVLVGAVAGLLVGGGAALAIAIGSRREAQLLYSLGALAAFGLASFLPESPPNLVAKLALGSPTQTTWVTLVGLVAVAAAGYAGLRWYVGTVSVGE